MATSKGGAKKGSGTKTGLDSPTGAVKRGKAEAPPAADTAGSAAAGAPGGTTGTTAKPAGTAKRATKTPAGGAKSAGDNGAGPTAKKAANDGAATAKKAVKKAAAVAGDAASRAVDTAESAAGRAAGAAGTAGAAALDLIRDLRDWATPRLSGWTHMDWTGLLESLRGRGHDVSDTETVGRSLERERLRLVLEGVEGLGPRRAETLVERYGTLWSLRQAGAEEIAASTGISRALADRVVQTVR